jgi:phage-related baseplate assembly protein
MNDGSAPDTEIIDAINAICNDEKRRPLTDTVVIKAPNKTDFSIEVELILLTDAVQQDVVDKVTANLEAYRDARKNKLGIDVVLTQLIGACQVEGVYSVAIVSPLFDIVAGVSDYNNCTGITVTVTGTHDA